MCGLAGIVSPVPGDHQHIAAMTDALAHRGPDGSGIYQDEGISLGHRRLSIIDLSRAASQPMANEESTIFLVCNGEIYNYKELTTELRAKGHKFRSRSDNEVILHLYEEHGLDFLNKVNGMFALALWDSRHRRLVAAVDRFGKKPLYYAVDKGRFAFASELKSLMQLAWFDRALDLRALDRYLSFRYVPTPLTIYRSAKKLKPSSLLVFEAEKFSIRRYWQPTPNGEGANKDFSTEDFAELLEDAVRIRMNSDVPLGVYLSSGVDSATVAGFMSNVTTGPKVSYTVAFDYEFNERAQAERLAQYLGYTFNPVSVGADDFNNLPTIAKHLDEPFGDLIVLASYHLAKTTKEQLTVTLTGDGADEIFIGYLHQKMMNRWRVCSPLQGPIFYRQLISRLVGLVPHQFLNLAFDYPDRLGPREQRKFVQALAQSGSLGSFYEGVTTCFTARDKENLYTNDFRKAVDGEPLSEEFQRAFTDHKEFSFLSRLSLMDLKYWIPFIVLFRLDKLNMAHAVETRSPYLDYRVVEAALNMPDSAKLTRGRDKDILRRVHERQFPEDLWAKGKQAFYMPFLKAEQQRFNAWIEDRLSRKNVERWGFFHWPYIQDLKTDSSRGSMLANRQLVALAMLEEWHAAFER
jgi:asparagine synthase (glutamine-hydrolysing)